MERSDPPFGLSPAERERILAGGRRLAAGGTPWPALRERIAVVGATVRLMVVAGARFGDLMPEVDRRELVMRDWSLASGRGLAASARRRALESVYDDVAAGRL